MTTQQWLIVCSLYKEHNCLSTTLILQAPITSGDGKNTNFLSDFIESIRESLGVEPSTASADLEDDQIDQAINDRLSQEQVDIG